VQQIQIPTLFFEFREDKSLGLFGLRIYCCPLYGSPPPITVSEYLRLNSEQAVFGEDIWHWDIAAGTLTHRSMILGDIVGLSEQPLCLCPWHSLEQSEQLLQTIYQRHG